MDLTDMAIHAANYDPDANYSQFTDLEMPQKIMITVTLISGSRRSWVRSSNGANTRIEIFDRIHDLLSLKSFIKLTYS